MDKIGTLTFDIYGELVSRKDLETFFVQMDRILSTVSDLIDIDYKVFSDYAATIQIVVQLKIMWKTDLIFNTFRKLMFKHFSFWRFKITLEIHETKFPQKPETHIT